MEIQKQFLRKGRDYNRSGAQLRPKLIGLYELKDNLPNMLASNVVSHQDEGITTVFHCAVPGSDLSVSSVSKLNHKLDEALSDIKDGRVIPVAIDLLKALSETV
mgnify:CR=1 FL=1